MRKKNVLFIGITLVILILSIILFFVIRYLSKNTSILTGDITEEQLAENNQNYFESESLEEINFNTLIEQELIVHKRYQAGVWEKKHTLNIPEGFEISLFVGGLKSPRFFDIDENNTLYVTDKGSNTLLMIKDTDKDGIADETTVIDDGLKTPHGIDYYKGDIYLGEEHQIVVYRRIESDGTYQKKEVLISDLPTGGHSTRTVVIGPDKKLYVAIGSSCNVCEESDNRRAAIMRYDLDGSNGELFAEGLRNTVGFEFKYNFELEKIQILSVDNGRDLIGDEIPPEEVNIIEEGKHYGWPYCYGDGNYNPEFPEKDTFCKNETTFPAYKMQAHSAPLGIAVVPQPVLDKQLWPWEMMDDLYIGFHGSWNRTVPTGYKVVRIDTSDPDAQVINFITGWLEQSGDAWGRPVDVGFDNDGIMYITDDKAGGIYRVEYIKD